MDKKTKDKLIRETTLDDIPSSCRPLVELIGLENTVRLSEYSRGDKIYFPKVESLLRRARDRDINKEYTGYNEKELADKYDLTIEQIRRILRDNDPLQMSLFEFIKE